MALLIPGSGPPALAKLRLARGADIQVDAKTMREIQTVFNQAEESIRTGNLEALMELYSKDYRFGGLTKDDRRQSWKDFFTLYHRISTSHSFSRISVKPGKDLTAEVMCTGSIWATSNGTTERINLASWLGDLHYLIHEEGEWRIHGKGKIVAKTAQYGGGPPPLF
jgi:hypothetical protein